jgi:hypothetical protein
MSRLPTSPTGSGIVAAAFLAVLLVASPPSSSAEPAAATSTVNEVTVTVTPLSFDRDAKHWSFRIEFDTHTQSLNDDIVHTVTLTAADGRPLKPLAWEGAAPGGHHRTGVVHFARPSPPPQTLEVRMHREGESLARAFRWRLP